MRKNLIFLILLSLNIAISSCKKESIKYPVSYTSRSFDEIRIKVYTVDGEILDSNLRKTIVEKFKSHLSNLDSIDINGTLTIKYSDKDNVELIDNELLTSEHRNAYEISGILYWEDKNYSAWFGSRNFEEKHLVYHPLFVEQGSPPPSGGEYFNIKKCNYATRQNNQLHYPCLDYIIARNYIYNSVTRLNNVFKPESYRELSSSDTIIIQEYNILFKE